MKSKTFSVKITGETPLLMHHDNLSWSDTIRKWSTVPANKKNGVAGDDRSPAWRWIGNIYTNNGLVCIPADNLMTLLREGGSKCPTGKGQGTFKRQTQSGLVVNEAAWTLIGSKGEIPTEQITELIDNDNFEEHEQRAVDLGFSLFVKRAKIGNAKHVRVRPRFDVWSAAGTITVFDETITRDTLQMILTHAGNYAGVGDWRPSSPKSPGPWGKFTAEIK